MTVLCLGALLAGLIAAPLVPFVPFACALALATVIGSAWAIIAGGPFGGTAWSAFALLFVCQIGYGLGIVATAIIGRGIARRRSGGEEQDSSPARQLRTGHRPH